MELKDVPMTPISVAVGAMIVAFATKTNKGMTVLEEAIRLAGDEAARSAVVQIRGARRPADAIAALDQGDKWLRMLHAFAKAKGPDITTPSAKAGSRWRSADRQSRR